MNNLKKTVAVVLAVAMVLTMGIATSFAAFTDVPSTVAYAEAVNILNNLGIINGYEDGTFRPDNTITRAEVATILCNTFDLTPVSGATVFSDVPADHWAAGYINAAYNAKIIAGMGDGTFAPGADVTYEQVVKMIVAGLNYTIAADQQGGYPTGYLAIASSNGITSGASGTVGQAATRATVARLVYNSLEVGMLSSNAFTTTGEITYVVDDTQTILSRLGVEKLEVVVSGSYLTDDTYDSNNRNVTLESNRRYNQDDYPNSNYITEDLVKGSYIGEFDEGGTAAASLLGYACVAYVGVDDETDVDTIFAISAKGTTNSVTTVTSSMFDSEAAGTDNSRIYYSSNNRSYRLTPASDVEVFVNYVNTTDATSGINASSNTERYEEELRDGGVVDFIDNDNDGEFEYAIVSQYTSEAVISEITEEDGVWYFDTLAGDIEEYDPEEEDVLKLFIKGENYIDVTELASGDTVTEIAKGNGGDIILYYVSSDKVEGSVTEYDSSTETYTIGNTSGIGTSPLSGISYSDVVNKDGIFYLNADGLISYIDGSVSVSGDYGYVTGVDTSTSFSTTTYEVQIVDANGNTNEYTLSSRVSVYNRDGERDTYNDRADVANLIETKVLDEFAHRIIRFTTSGSGTTPAITSIVLSGYDDAFEENTISNSRAYDAEDMTIGGATFTSSTVVFNFSGETEDDYNDPDNISVGRVTSFFSDGAEYGGEGNEIYYYGDPDAVSVVLARDLSTAIDESENVFIVSSTSIRYISGYNAVVVTGYKGGSSFSFTLYNEDDPAVGDYYVGDEGACTLAKGSILMIGDISNGGYVTDLDSIREIVRIDVENGRVVSLPRLVDDDAYTSRGDDIVQGIVGIDVGATRDYSNNDRIVFTSWMGDSEYYRPSSSTMITLVDLSDGTKLSDVEVASNRNANALRFNEDYAGCAYIRLYDTNASIADMDIQANRGDVIDVVGYRYTVETYEDFNGDEEYGGSVTTSGVIEDDEDEEEVIEGEVIEEVIEDSTEIESEVEEEVVEEEIDVEEVIFEEL